MKLTHAKVTALVASAALMFLVASRASAEEYAYGWEELSGINVFGGLAPLGGRFVYARGGDIEDGIIRYNINADRWKTVAQYEIGHDTAVRGCAGSGRIFWVDRSYYNEGVGVSWLNPLTNEVKQSSPFLDAGLPYYTEGGVTYAGGYIFTGGLQFDGQPPARVLLRFYPPLREWRIMCATPEGRIMSEYEALGDWIYAVAANKGGIWRYSIPFNRWEKVSDAPDDLGQNPAVCLDPRDEKLYILPERVEAGLSAIVSYSIRDRKWEMVRWTPVPIDEGYDICFSAGYVYFTQGIGPDYYFGRLKVRD